MQADLNNINGGVSEWWVTHSQGQAVWGMPGRLR
jgi:hypothetical protein